MCLDHLAVRQYKRMLRRIDLQGAKTSVLNGVSMVVTRFLGKKRGYVFNLWPL